MKTLNRILLACCAMSAALGVAAADSGDAQQLMNKMAGVYKHRFMSGVIVPGKADEPYQAENVIEIVPYDADHVYLRVHLDFYNGHDCTIWGIARYEKGAFVYHGHEPEPEGYPQCRLRVGVDKDKLRLTDRDSEQGISSCRAYCGVRGSLVYDIGMDKRRDIRYMDRLKESRQYRQAIDELDKEGR
jgi:hypothetical protein